MDDEKALLTVEEVASYLKLAPLTVRRMIERGDLTAIKVGRFWRIRWNDLQEYLNRSTSRQKESFR
jgi:excisionase family DNA binding protein